MNTSLKDLDFPPGLYLVATPIGNLRDMTLRALDVLAAADMVLCEDTRVTGRLLQAYDIDARMRAYNDHNADRQRGAVLETLSAGAVVALVSDAGTPLISDPGYKLVRDCLDLGIAVTALPGANAPLTALQLSGLPSDAFGFGGFLPSKSEARRKKLQEWTKAPGSLIFFESGPRLAAALEDIGAVLGDRPAAVVREMTKLYEESRRGAVLELARHYREEGPPKGEIVIITGPQVPQDGTADIDRLLREALSHMSVRDAAAHVATATAQAKKDIYRRALELAGRAQEQETGDD